MLVRLLLPRSIRRPQWTTTTAASFHCRASGLFQEESDDVPRIRLPPVSAELSDPLRAIDSHRPKIRSRVLSDTYYQQLQDDLSLRFTVPQLRHYLKSQNKRVPSKAKKKDLLLSILNDAWGLSSQSMAREAERRKRQGRIRHHFKAEREELFFIIGENGATLREIEDNHRVRVTINVEDGQCAIEGRKQDVEAAKRAIKEHLHLVHESMDIPPLSVGLEEMIRNFQPVLVDISRGSGTFIDIQDGKFMLTAQSTSAIIRTKRTLLQTLTELGLTEKRPLSASDHTFIDLRPEIGITESPTLAFLPVHDTRAMSSTEKSGGWSRVARVDAMSKGYVAEEHPLSFYLLSSSNSNQGSSETSQMNIGDIKKIITDGLGLGKRGNIQLTATFGNLLFGNPVTELGANILTPPIEDSFKEPDLREYMQKSKSRRVFFGTVPPANITMPFLPLPYNDVFHRRSVVLNYVNTREIVSTEDQRKSTSPPEDYLKRLEIEILIHENGRLDVDRLVGEHDRTSVDLLAVTGSIDVRLLAQRYTLFNDKENIAVPPNFWAEKVPASLHKLMKECELVGYSDFVCPGAVTLEDNEDMQLLDVSFKNESRYISDESLVLVSDIEKQSDRTRHTILTMMPINTSTETGTDHRLIANGLDYWDSFCNTLKQLARRWRYTSQS